MPFPGEAGAPSPVGSAGPLPASAAPGARTAGERKPLNWNYWVDLKRGRAKPNPITEPLQRQVPYQFRVRLTGEDLSAIPGIGNTASSPQLDHTVDTVLADATRDELVLDVLIHPSDNYLVEIEPKDRKQILRIDLARLRGPASANSTNSAAPGPDNDGQNTLAEFAFNFKLRAPGRQQVAISIIDAESGLPLQNMIAELNLDHAWPESATVSSDGQTELTTTVAPFDVALYLYELDSTIRDVTFSSLQAELRYRDKATQTVTYYQWSTDTTIARLQQAAETFKTTADATTDSDELLEKGYELAQSIFSPKSIGPGSSLAKTRNSRTADSARKAIVAASRYSDESAPPSMLVKIVNGTDINKRYSSVLLPIGALGVSENGLENAVFLGERFSLALLLAGQTPRHGAQCPTNWYVALPRRPSYAGALQEAYDGVREIATRWPNAFKEQSNSFTDLKTWFDPKNDEPQPQVFAFIGHHGSTRLFFERDTGGMTVENMRRDFGGTSIAILNACDSAMGHINDSNLVGHLAKSNVASVISTTSTISGHLAAAYMQCMDRVLSLPRTLTIGQAHALTTQCLRNRGPARPVSNVKDFSGNALKYILVGNPHQAVCAPQKLVENQ